MMRGDVGGCCVRRFVRPSLWWGFILSVCLSVRRRYRFVGGDAVTVEAARRLDGNVASDVPESYLRLPFSRCRCNPSPPHSPTPPRHQFQHACFPYTHPRRPQGVHGPLGGLGINPQAGVSEPRLRARAHALEIIALCMDFENGRLNRARRAHRRGGLVATLQGGHKPTG